MIVKAGQNNKTVFFLGAGFSKDAGGPIQNEILRNILGDGFKRHYSKQNQILKDVDSFKKFLTDDLCLSEDQFDHIALEDVFTPIDRCLSQGTSFRLKSPKDLIDLREKLHTLMGYSIQYGVSHKNAEYITKFAKYINSQAKKRLGSEASDCVSVITTNWDILLDNELNKLTTTESKAMCGSDQENGPIAVVDYCCYISSLEDDPFIKPGLLALGRGGYNIKYLKLHGSMNWLHCPACHRLYVKFQEATMFSKHYCKHCKNNYQYRERTSIQLRGNLILPTFLKDFSNVQMQLIWQNAGIELSEASKVVFIGYSLPAADFEIRQLLSRYIRKDAEIEVVLHPGHNTTEEAKRYRNFFGNRKVSFLRMTVEDYIDSVMLKP